MKYKVVKIISIIILISLVIGLLLLYGPYKGFRDWLITTSLSTMSHQYIAHFFYTGRQIEETLSRNYIVEINESVNTDLINFDITSDSLTEYDKQILDKDPANNDYKIILIEGKTYSGYLIAIYDPSRIRAIATKHIPDDGQYLQEMAEENDALLTINGGNFWDPNFGSTGGLPIGITICDNTYVTTEDFVGCVVGFDHNNRLIISRLSEYSTDITKNLGLRDAVTCFGPRLIINGKKSEQFGNGGLSQAQRTVIGQRKDGITLFLTLEGRTLAKPGADMNDLIQIMANYGAYNAINLDGGTSTELIVNNKRIIDVINAKGQHQSRKIATGFMITKDDSEDSDHSVIEDKLK